VIWAALISIIRSETVVKFGKEMYFVAFGGNKKFPVDLPLENKSRAEPVIARWLVLVKKKALAFYLRFLVPLGRAYRRKDDWKREQAKDRIPLE
jgi:hypothetical protein